MRPRILIPDTLTFVSLVTDFKNEVPNNTSESAYKFLARNSYIKGEKIERLHAYCILEMWRFKMLHAHVKFIGI